MHESIKSQQIIESIQQVKEQLEITSYDDIESEDYNEILEYKFRKTMGVLPILIQSMRFLKSKKAIGISFENYRIFLLKFNIFRFKEKKMNF